MEVIKVLGLVAFFVVGAVIFRSGVLYTFWPHKRPKHISPFEAAEAIGIGLTIMLVIIVLLPELF